MTISEAIDKKLGNATPSVTIAEALGATDGVTSIADAIEALTTPDVTIKYTVTYNANGGTGTIASVDVVAGQSMNVSDGTGLTAPEGKEFSGWAKSASAKSATITSTFTPDKDTTLYAVWVDKAPDPEPEPDPDPETT